MELRTPIMNKGMSRSLLNFEPVPLLTGHRIHEDPRQQDRDRGALLARSRSAGVLGSRLDRQLTGA